MNDNQQHVKWFRDSSPYIHAHRGKTFVIYLNGEALAHDNFHNIIDDIVLLNSLGVRLVIVFGATPQISRYLRRQDMAFSIKADIRITTPDILPYVQQVVGSLRIDIEAVLSRGLINAPVQGGDISVVSGNFIKARPLGIIGGTDYHNTGAVRKVKAQSIRQHLDREAIVLIPPIGYSPSGEVFNLRSTEVAPEVAAAILADKLIIATDSKGLMDHNNQLISEVQVADINNANASKPLSIAKDACLKGVSRCHLISYADDGALLEELFTRDGAGTQVNRHSYEQVRAATPDDVASIIELLEPLENAGVLVRRSRELLESEIRHFIIIDRDGMIVSCAALYPFTSDGELACLATHPDYRKHSRGDTLLKAIEQKARQLKLHSIFVLTTQTAHWFKERGFEAAALSTLPNARQNLYNFQRNSRLFRKTLG